MILYSDVTKTCLTQEPLWVTSFSLQYHPKLLIKVTKVIGCDKQLENLLNVGQILLDSTLGNVKQYGEYAY